MESCQHGSTNSPFPGSLTSTFQFLGSVCTPKGRRALLRIPSTEGRSVCLCWEHSKPKGPWCRWTTFWRPRSALPSTFPDLFPCTVLKGSLSAVLSHFQKCANYFSLGNSRPETSRFLLPVRNVGLIYYTTLLQKPGTNIDEIDDFSSNRCLFGQFQSTASNCSIRISNVLETGPFLW